MNKERIMADRSGPIAEALGASGGAARRSAAAATGPLARCCEHEGVACRVCRETGARVVASDELLQGARELLIVHGDQVYRLVRTRNDKLLLQK